MIARLTVRNPDLTNYVREFADGLYVKVLRYLQNETKSLLESKAKGKEVEKSDILLKEIMWLINPNNPAFYDGDEKDTPIYITLNEIIVKCFKEFVENTNFTERYTIEEEGIEKLKNTLLENFDVDLTHSFRERQMRKEYVYYFFNDNSYVTM